jgi:hypothetical protein
LLGQRWGEAALNRAVVPRTHILRGLRGASRLASAAVALAWLSFAERAGADSTLRLQVDWGKLAEVIRDGGASLFSDAAWPLHGDDRSEPPPISEEMRWFRASPHLSLVARDWGGAQLVVGHLSLTDQWRLTRSSRMLVARVRFAEGRLAPFGQIGLGQWRIDTDLVPSLPRDLELAGQLGSGFELRLAEATTVALEADYTVLYREQHEPQMVCGPHVWAAFIAARSRF